MGKSGLGIALVGLVVALAACGRVPSSSSATESPSPAATPSAAATPLTIPRPTLHDGEVGLAYAPVQYTATGGTDAYLWTISSGALPGGLTLSQDGRISGTPTAAGTFTFTVEVTDAATATANLSGSIAVVAQLALARISSAGPGWPWDRVNRQDMDQKAAGPIATQSGGLGPYTYAVTAGSLPPGTYLSGLTVIGIPITTGESRFTVTVTDSLGATAAVSYFIDIIPPHPAR
jgi:putative Ig domain-containing protein